MGRPRKQTVDYFPHDAGASDGDTLTILQNRFGNDGYAFWFKLLERISSSENHIIDCRNSMRWQLLLAKTRTNQETGDAIMEMLCELDAIDTELWHKDRIIWCQNLVDNVADVYKNRNSPVPVRPVPINDNPVSSKKTGISSPDNTQSKVNKSKVNKSILLPDWLNKDTWNDFLEMRKTKKAYPTERAKELLLKELLKLKTEGNDPDEVLKQSIMRNYTGVFPVKEVRQNGTNQQNVKSGIPGNRPAGAFDDLEKRN